MDDDYDPFEAAAYDPFEAAEEGDAAGAQSAAPAPPPEAAPAEAAAPAIDAASIAASLAAEMGTLKAALQDKQAVALEAARELAEAARLKRAEEDRLRALRDDARAAAVAANAAEIALADAEAARILGTTELTLNGVRRCLANAVLAYLAAPPPKGDAAWTVAALKSRVGASPGDVRRRLDAHPKRLPAVEEMLDVYFRVMNDPKAWRGETRRLHGARRRAMEKGQFTELSGGLSFNEFLRGDAAFDVDGASPNAAVTAAPPRRQPQRRAWSRSRSADRRRSPSDRRRSASPARRQVAGASPAPSARSSARSTTRRTSVATQAGPQPWAFVVST